MDGQPAISFFVYGDGYALTGLWYADFDGTQWHYQTIDVGSGSGPGHVGGYNSLAEIAGQPAISYYDRLARSLSYARFDGTAWLTPTVVTRNVREAYTSVAEVDGQPAISYLAGISGTLNYARFDGTNWLTTTVANSGQANFGTSTSLVVIDGQPAISYHYDDRDTSRLLNYAWFDGTSWLTTTVDSAVGRISSLAVVNGQPAISYAAGVKLNYAWFDGASWLTTTVDSTGYVGRYNSLMEVDGQPAISYTRRYPQSENSGAYDNLLYAWFDGTRWLTTTVDSDVNAGRYNSLAEVNGKPAIAYYSRYDGGTIKYAYFTGASWQIKTISCDGGIHPSLTVINGHPAISFRGSDESSGYTLKFIQLDLTDFPYVQAFLPLINN